jgi:hypothetical protein
MSFSSWLVRWQPFAPSGRRHARRRIRPDRRPRFEALENRSLLTTFYAATAADLIKDINAANKTRGANTIVLTAPATSPYVLTATNNSTDGPTVLPVIKQGDTLTILTDNGSANPGNGDTIDASRNGRLFDVATGASLTLQNVTLQNGHVSSSSVSVGGGAIYNHGTLVLSKVLIQNNAAFASFPKITLKGLDAAGAAGGAIGSNFSLTVENQTVIQGNSAVGENAGGYFNEGNAFGGGIYIAGGTANITGTTFAGNTAEGAVGGYGGSAYGGAVYVAGGTVILDNVTLGGNTAEGNFGGFGYGGGLYVAGGNVTLTNDTITQNAAGPESDGFGGFSRGGGVFIASGPTVNVHIDLSTFYSTYQNLPDDIDGTYTLTV